MAIIRNANDRQVDYVQLTFSNSAKAPLGLSLPDARYENFEQIPGVGGQIRHIHLRTRRAGENELETCTIYFEDEGQERGTALQFTTGGPDGYSFSAGHLVAKLMACHVRDPIEIYSYVFKEGSEGKDREGNPYIRDKAEIALVVKQNGHKILKPNWGQDEDGNALERGPETPFLKNAAGKDTAQRDMSLAREWMVGALRSLQSVYNRPRASQQDGAADRPFVPDDLPDDYGAGEPAQARPERSRAQRFERQAG